MERAGARCSAAAASFRRTRTGAIACFSTSIFTATTAPGLEPTTRRAGRDASPGSCRYLQAPAPNVASKAARRLWSSVTVRRSLLHESVAELFGGGTGHHGD